MLFPRLLLLVPSLAASSIIPNRRAATYGLPTIRQVLSGQNGNNLQLTSGASHRHIPPPLRLEGGKDTGKSHFHPFEPAENSVGLLLTFLDTHNDEDAPSVEVQHFWMPLGKKVYTRDHPNLLPSHPLTARLTTLIHTSPEMASLEQLGLIRCTVHTTIPREPRPRHSGEGKNEWEFGNGLVKFGDERGSPGTWLSGRSVESWECI